MKQARPPAKQNLTRGEKTALKDLKSDETVLVTKADKGNSIVVMNRTDYQNQVTKMLEDTMVYKHITDKRRNPTTKTELELEKILKDLKRSENLTEKEYWQLKPFDSSPATFYGLPKVHKVPLVCSGDHFTFDKDIDHQIPLRPINSNIGSPTYQLSKYLAKLLKYLCLNNDFVVNNSKEFTEFIRHQKLETNEIIVSFDVVSLFTSIPVAYNMLWT